MSTGLILYQTDDGLARVQLRAVDGSVWLTQLEIGELFATTKQNVSLHAKNIFAERELVADSVVKDSLTTAADGKSYRTQHYSLPLTLVIGRIHPEIWRGFRRAVFGLNPSLLASLRDAGIRGDAVRWCRFAQPPATSWDPSGMKSSSEKRPTQPHHEATGFKACSRWLSAATPPASRHPTSRTPAGVSANNAYAIDPHQPPLPSDLRHQESRILSLGNLASATPRIPWRNGTRTRRASRGNRWSGRPCPFARFAESHASVGGFHAGIEKSLFVLGAGNMPPDWVSLAGRVCGLHGECFGAGFRAHLHCQSRRTSSEEIVSRGVDWVPPKIGRGFRRAIFGLNPSRLASLRDAGIRGDAVRWCRFAQPPATSWYPSGMKSSSQGHLMQRHHEATGFKACSRWLSKATPPDSHHPKSRTPAGVSASATPAKQKGGAK